MLESQRLMNESAPVLPAHREMVTRRGVNEQNPPGEPRGAEAFRRISVPLIRRLYPGMEEYRKHVLPKEKVNWLKEGF